MIKQIYEQADWVAITGASSGIGRATALYFAARGYPVALIARREERLEQVRAERGALWAARERVDEEGLKTELAGRSLGAWAQELVALAQVGVSRWEPEASELLTPLAEAVAEGRCPADVNRELWSQGIDALMEGTRLA